MAVDTQDITATGHLTPLNTILTEPSRFRSAEPWGLLVHQRDSLTGDGVGVGDNARVRMILDLPDGFAYLLKFLAVTFRIGGGTMTNAEMDEWKLPGLETFLQMSNETDVTSAQIDMPLSQTGYGQSTVDDVDAVTFQLGGGSQAHAGIDAPGGEWPQQIPMMYGGTTDPRFNVINTATNTGTFQISFYAQWLAYNIEQTNSSGVWWSVPTTE